jgi:hypothetical protein
MPGFVYGQKKESIYVNLYVSSEASFTVNQKDLSLSVESEMPWGGASTITVSAREEVKGVIKLRVPVGPRTSRPLAICIRIWKQPASQPGYPSMVRIFRFLPMR